MIRKYQGVEQLIYKGFLTTKVESGGIPFVLKSINTKELDIIKDLTPFKSSPPYNKMFESLIISFAIYLFDGENALINRPHNIKEISKSLLELPQNIRMELMDNILILQKTQDYELHRLEAYSYEPESRQIWKSYKGNILNSPLLTGISGTENLGLNSHQIAWTFLNTEEDHRIHSEDIWGYSKFIASASNPKGVKSIDQKDRARLQSLQEERERIRAGLEYNGPIKIEHRSVEDLRAQLQADLDGKQDLHDKIISSYEASLQERRKQRMLEQEEVLQTMKDHRSIENLTDAEIEKRYSNGEDYVTLLSKEQLEDMRKRQNNETMNWAKTQEQNRIQKSKMYHEDRKDIAEKLKSYIETQDEMPSKLVLSEDNIIPEHINTKPVKNSRLPISTYVPPTPQKDPSLKVNKRLTKNGTPNQKIGLQQNTDENIDEDYFFGESSVKFPDKE